MAAGYVLAFDFGLRHIGVSVGQFVTRTASPLITLRATGGKPSWPDIASLIDEWQPSHLLVGLPLNMDDSESEMSLRARAIGQDLGRRHNVPVAMVDERLSTREAQTMDPERGHEMAAVLIAESWLGEARQPAP
mgnify:FL=1